MRDTIRRFGIPPQPFLDLLFAFEQDQLVKRYRTYEQLLGYCRCSANPVGRLVLYLSEAFDPVRAALSDHICTALQLANFWQDVARDFAIGRVYLPGEDRRQFGYSDDDLAARRFTPAFAELLRFEVDRTRDLFYRGIPLVEQMPASMQTDIELFLHGGLAILRKIEQGGYNVWARRPALAKWEKGLLLAGAMATPTAAPGRLVERNPNVRTPSWMRRTAGVSRLVECPPAGSRRPFAESRRNPTPGASVWRDGKPATSITPFVCCRRPAPRDVRLYAFMRVADDLTDGPEAVAEKRLALAELAAATR